MKALKWINTGAFAAMVIVNMLANLIPIGGNTTGQVSEAYPNLFTPAPITFSIWGIIYILLAGFVLWQWEIFDKGVSSARIREQVGLWFVISCMMNIAWILLWHNNAIELSLLCIVGLLVTLIVIQKRVVHAEGSGFQRLMAKSGFSIYFGWIIAATIANISVMLVKLGWDGFGLSPDFWTTLVLLTGAFIAVLVIRFGRNRVAGLGVMWAYAGILFRHLSTGSGFHPFIITAAFIGEAVMLAALVLPQDEPLMLRNDQL